MKIKPIHRTSVCDEIVDQFKLMIADKDLLPGQKLPSERELAQMFNVSKSSVREALIILSSIGLIQRNSEGSYVNDNIIASQFTETYSLLLTEQDYAELYEARKLIEAVTVQLAARKADAEDIQMLEEIVEMMEDVVRKIKDPYQSIEAYVELDIDFHMHLAMAGKNKVLCEFISTVRKFLNIQVSKMFTYKLQQKQDIYRIAQERHRKIVEAIMNRDPKTARDVMILHLDIGEEVFF